MSTTADTVVIAAQELQDAGPDLHRVVLPLLQGGLMNGHLLDPLVLTKDFEDSLHRYGASNERLEQLLQEEKEVLESATPEDVLAGLRPMVLQGMMVLSSYHRLDQDSWYTAVSVLDSYLAKAGELDVGKLPLTCVAVVRLVKKFHGNVADQFGSTSAQWLDGARQLAKAMQDQGHQMESLEFTEIMLSQHEIDILEVLQWQIDAPLLQQWLSTYCQRFNILTDHKHETAVSWVKTRAMYFARLLLFVEASSSRSPPREFALGLFCLGLVWSQLLPADCLRPEKVPSAYWVAGFQELSQRHRVQTMPPLFGASFYPLIQATTASSSCELQEATHRALVKILVLGAQHPALLMLAAA